MATVTSVAVTGIGDARDPSVGAVRTSPFLDSGRCGMAGACGFERDHPGVSVKVGERVPPSAIPVVPRHTTVMADGFSRQEQTAQTIDRRALNVAQVVKMTLR